MSDTKLYSWTVIGAGAAGILAVGKLLDEKVLPQQILWIDEKFVGGDIVKKWYEVPGNTKVDSLNGPLYAFKSLNYSEQDVEMKLLDPNEVCSLGYVAEALEACVKELLKYEIDTCKECAINIDSKSNDEIIIHTENSMFRTKKLIIATGSEEKTPDDALSLDIALCPTKLKNMDFSNKTVGVIGSSHSAILVLRNLISAGATDIVNFYRSFTRYALPYNGKIIYDNTGLKGLAAAWARDNLENNNKINRVHVSDADYNSKLNDCDVMVYATGFEPRNIAINNVTNYKHNPHHGIIAPNIYGLGIAYPETTTDDFGNIEQNVGLLKFMNYINKVFPVWQL